MALKDLLETLRQGVQQYEARAAYDEQKSSLMAMIGGLGSVQQSSVPGPRGGKSNPSGGGNSEGGMGRRRAFLEAISTQESGGNYDAIGVPTKYGTAYGKYQILDSNIQGSGGWDKEALGRDISVQKFHNTPRLQEKIARHKLREYFKQYGPEGAAKAWYAGPGNANTNSDAPQYGGPSINDYAASVLKHMKGYR